MNLSNSVWMVFVFLLGASTGSFLNVVVYRLPLELSIVKPGSHCPRCKHPLAWYDNLPIFAWVLLRGRCRYCRAGFSIRYPTVELLTGLLFVGLFWAYFEQGARPLLPPFEQGGWIVYSGHIILICVLLASSLIDAEHWIIPLSVSYAGVAAALILSIFTPYFLDADVDELWRLTPFATAKTAAAALGATLGLLAAGLMLKFGIIKRSFAEYEEASERAEKKGEEIPEDQLHIRGEMVREMAFLTPVVGLGLICMIVLTAEGPVGRWWSEMLGQKWLAGLLGSVIGFMIGGAVVWATRILGSLVFGREAMGLGDVHLMAAVGAMLGWQSPTVAFFLAPFFGLGFAVLRLVLHRTREIPYGPFLSMATVLVMICHDAIAEYLMATLQPAQITMTLSGS